MPTPVRRKYGADPAVHYPVNKRYYKGNYNVSRVPINLYRGTSRDALSRAMFGLDICI